MRLMPRGSRSIKLVALLVALSFVITTQADTIYDKDIHVVDYEDLEFPALAVMAHIEGLVVIRVSLNSNGNVVDAEALSGPSLFIPQTVENAKKWKFKPNSQKAAIIVYNFRIAGACHPIRPGGSSSHMTFFPPNLAEITVCPTPPMVDTSGSK